MITVCTVRRVSRVQFFYILLCKSAIRRLFLPPCSIAVFCTLSRLFVPFGLDLDLRLLGVRLAVHVHSCLGGDACLLSGNPKMRNPEPEKTDENQNPESINQRKQVLQILYCADLLP